MTDHQYENETFEKMLTMSKELVTNIQQIKNKHKKFSLRYDKLQKKIFKLNERFQKVKKDNINLREKNKLLRKYKTDTLQIVDTLQDAIEEQGDIIIDMTMQNAELQIETENQKQVIIL